MDQPRYMKIVAIIEALMKSSWLPGKTQLKAAGKLMIEHLVQRLSVVKSLNDVFLAPNPKSSGAYAQIALTLGFFWEK